MGKASRVKKARKQLQEPTSSPLEELALINELVARAFGTHADCADAAGFLVELGSCLGHDLTPRPVGLIARDKSTNNWVVMGPKATSQVPPSQIEAMENLWPEGRDTGHIVVTSADHKVMLDPNILQLQPQGIAVPHQVRRISSDSPDSGMWEYQWGDVQIVYYVDDGNESLLPRYEKSRHHRRTSTKRIAADIRSGRTLEEIIERAGRV